MAILDKCLDALVAVLAARVLFAVGDDDEDGLAVNAGFPIKAIDATTDGIQQGRPAARLEILSRDVFDIGHLAGADGIDRRVVENHQLEVGVFEIV